MYTVVCGCGVWVFECMDVAKVLSNAHCERVFVCFGEPAIGRVCGRGPGGVRVLVSRCFISGMFTPGLPRLSAMRPLPPGHFPFKKSTYLVRLRLF